MVDRNYNRRPGRFYKDEVSVSKYFTRKDSECDSKRNVVVGWVPPRSPYALIQEDLYSDPWQLLVATVFLTKTAAEKAVPQIHKFLNKYPSADQLLDAENSDILPYLSRLGLDNLRTNILKRFSHEYMFKDWRYPIELYGIGKYGNDSFKIFCAGEWRETVPDDIPLTLYRNWLLDNAEKLGL